MSTQEVILHNSAAQAVSAFMPVMTMTQAIERRDVILKATQNLMQPDVDFGVIPGTGTKPALLQPGADKLCNLFGLSVQYDFMEKVEDWSGRDHGGEPFFYYQVKGRAFRGDYLVGEGIGSCSSWESKYRYRKGERKCPECGAESIIKGKAEYGGGWICFQKKGGCGAKFKAGDQLIEGQETGRRPNPDIADQVNTILKMAVKRAKVATVINATSASEFFTQDVEDFPQYEPEDPRYTAPPPPRQETVERRMEEIRQQQQAERPEGDHTPRHAPELVAILNDMRNAEGCAEAIGRFKEAISSITGNDEDYYRILNAHGFQNRHDMKGKKASQAKALAVELFRFLKSCEASIAEPVGVAGE